GGDRGAVCAEPVWRWRATVPERRYGSVHGGRHSGILGASRPSGEGAGLSDRAWGDRGGAAVAWRCGAGGRRGAGGCAGREAAGGLWGGGRGGGAGGGGGGGPPPRAPFRPPAD